MRRLLPFALTLLLALPAQALILDSGDGQGNTSPPADDPGWSHVGRIGGPAGIYLGNGWVLTANHVILSDPEFQNVIYPIVPGSVVQLESPDESLADLKIFRIDPTPSLGLLKLRASTPAMNTTVTYIARGLSRGAATSWMGVGGYLWSANSGMRWGTNKVTTTGNVNDTLAFSTTFNQIPGGGSTTHEAMGANSDSGGAVFIKNASSVWELAGVLTAVGGFVGQPPGTALYGNVTWAADLSQYRAQLIVLTRPGCANEVDDDGDALVDWPADPGCASELDVSERPDQDGDGVDDPFDNCLARKNPTQVDSDLDGCGEFCDFDWNNDGTVSAGEVSVGAAQFGSPACAALPGPPFDNCVCDFNRNGVCTASEVSLIAASFGKKPGPSGITNVVCDPARCTCTPAP